MSSSVTIDGLTAPASACLQVANARSSCHFIEYGQPPHRADEARIVQQDRRDVITAQKRAACALCCHDHPRVLIFRLCFRAVVAPLRFYENASCIPNLDDSLARQGSSFPGCYLRERLEFGASVLRSDDDFSTSCQNVECSTQRPKRVHQARQKTEHAGAEHSGNPTFNPRAEDQRLEHLQEAVQVQLVKEMGVPIPRISRKLANINVRTRPSAPNACSNRGLVRD
jgi:hypothetical protein